MLADKLFAKYLQNLETCLSRNSNLCGKLIASLDHQSHLIQGKLIRCIDFGSASSACCLLKSIAIIL